MRKTRKQNLLEREQTWAVVNLKGGVGKTTTATCLAVCAAENGWKVGIGESDPQNSNERLQNALRGIRIASVNKPEPGEILLVDFAPGYDSDIHNGTHALLLRSEIAIIPAPCSEDVEKDTINTFKLANISEVPVVVVVPTWYGGTSACRVARRRLVRELGDAVAPVTVPYSLRHFRNAASARQTIMSHAPESKAALAYRQLFDYLLEIAKQIA